MLDDFDVGLRIDAQQEDAMTDATKPNWTARIFVSLMVAATLVGGFSWLNRIVRHAVPVPTTIATSCRGFEADAQKLFDKGDTATVSGTFAPGDRVHLAIDIHGVGYSWELTGVLAKRKVAQANSSASFSAYTLSAGMDTTGDSPVARGRISGYTTLELDIDVTEAGDGAITFNKPTGLSLPVPPRVAGASCTTSKKMRTVQQS
jgi:hypothetical protein